MPEGICTELKGEFLAGHCMRIDVFGTVATINERFAILQDTLDVVLGHTMEEIRWYGEEIV